MSSAPVTAFKISELKINAIRDLASRLELEQTLEPDQIKYFKEIKRGIRLYLETGANKLALDGSRDLSNLNLHEVSNVIKTIETFGEDIKAGNLITAKFNQQESYIKNIFNTLDLIFLSFTNLAKSFANPELATKIQELKDEVKGMLKYFSTTLVDLKEIVLSIADRWKIDINAL